MFAKEHPARGAEIVLEGLNVGKAEKAVADGLEGISESTLPDDKLFGLLFSMDKKGFRSTTFRTAASRALCNRATKREGLPPKVCALVESWIEPSWRGSEWVERSQSNPRPNEPPRSLLFHSHFALGAPLPDGPYWALRALTYGLLRRNPPDRDGWLHLLEQLLDRQDLPSTWRGLTHELRWLSGCGEQRVTSLLTRLFASYPQVRNCLEGASLLAQLSRAIPTDAFLDAVHAIRGSEWSEGPQAFGELVCVRAIWYPEDTPANAELDSLIRQAATDCTTRNAQVGAAFAAAHLWSNPAYRARATDVLVRSMPNADDRLSHAIMSVFLVTDSLLADDFTRRVLAGVAQNSARLIGNTHCEYMVEHPGELLPHECDLVYQLSRAIVDLRGDEMVSIQNAMFMSAGHLVNIALTLHRLGGEFRAKGLELFEQLLIMGVADAQAAMNELDLRPVNIGAPVLRPRRRARSR